ncbi:ATP-binding protein [Mesorhizobium sp. M8A.F.Ca.ET.207.01.1.1]|uniref:ATP-binding protein n=1 Tax=Mesorhizobium sp. M8A.F.Ca.ET.207.01.1.1 TaxID=2563968 RepID=UPI00109CD045|nr:ATP-binding protein [Mesorhizobium sp. M8A.F.Ca.ET.207.01.1.1]TGQ80253.1 ATP-binding protein [Mesorhizobium sp. M8A.F.Ca.ET.207.01.1.1]
MYAEDDFQLLNARTAQVRVQLPWRRQQEWMNPHVTFSEPPQNPQASSSEHITALIGKNGTGKSHLLSAIVQTFVILEQLQLQKRRTIKDFPLEFLSYRIDGRLCTIEYHGRQELECRIDGFHVPIFDLPLPRRVVALTISPFDKFPVPRSIRNSVKPVEPSLYEYLGLRDQFGKASMESLLFRSLNNLFEEGENEALRRINIGSVFEFLGLEPILTVIYRVRIHSSVINTLRRGQRVDWKGFLNFSESRNVGEMLRTGFSEGELNELLELALHRADKGIIRTTADFRFGGELDETFRILQPLRRAGFIRLSGVEVKQINGPPSNLRHASSGQLSMISALLALASVINNASLVLIDEPELSLHPEWQVDYVNLLVKTFARFKGCHFVIATHSPMVISELPKHANVIALDQPALPSTETITGQSTDYLLAEVFGSPMPGNLYIREQVVSALGLISKGKARSPEFSEVMADLTKITRRLRPDDPIASIIGDISDVARAAGTTAHE